MESTKCKSSGAPFAGRTIWSIEVRLRTAMGGVWVTRWYNAPGRSGGDAILSMIAAWTAAGECAGDFCRDIRIIRETRVGWLGGSGEAVGDTAIGWR